MSAKFTFLAWDTPIENAPLKLALLQLANNADDDGFSYYSISKMALSCGMSDRTFMRKIAELEEKGILTVERRANRPSLYTLIGDEMGVTLCHLQKSEVTACHAEVTESHLVGDSVSHDPNRTPNTSPESIVYCPISDVLSHLNASIGSKYKKSTSSHASNIRARLNDHSTEDLKLVIDHKIKSWGSDAKMVSYLRPQTLFSASKFEGYLIAARADKLQGKQELVNDDLFIDELNDQYKRSQAAKARREARGINL